MNLYLVFWRFYVLHDQCPSYLFVLFFAVYNHVGLSVTALVYVCQLVYSTLDAVSSQSFQTLLVSCGPLVWDPLLFCCTFPSFHPALPGWSQQVTYFFQVFPQALQLDSLPCLHNLMSYVCGGLPSLRAFLKDNDMWVAHLFSPLLCSLQLSLFPSLAPPCGLSLSLSLSVLAVTAVWMLSASLSVAPAPPSWLCECVCFPFCLLSPLLLCSFSTSVFSSCKYPSILLAPLNLFFPVLQAFG